MHCVKPFAVWALPAFALLIAESAAVAQADQPAQARKPNIVLCMTDDQGWGDVSYNGLKQIQTPNLDAMAAAGVRFSRFYAQQSCSPTRASVMTGRHPNRMGVFWPGMPLRKQEITIAQAVKTAGYVTGHFGKWHLNGVAGPGKVMPDSDPLSPRNVGFDESFSVSNYFELDWTFGRNGVPEKATGDGSDVIVAEALKFIERNVKEEKPFFACVWFGSPHAPHKPLPEDLKAAGGSGYFGELIGVDRAMGTLRAGLRKLGIADNTIVWFNSDNGGWIDPAKPDANGVSGGLRGRKGDMWEGGLRVPCVVEWPGRIKQPFVDGLGQQVPRGRRADEGCAGELAAVRAAEQPRGRLQDQGGRTGADADAVIRQSWAGGSDEAGRHRTWRGCGCGGLPADLGAIVGRRRRNSPKSAAANGANDVLRESIIGQRRLVRHGREPERAERSVEDIGAGLDRLYSRRPSAAELRRYVERRTASEGQRNA
ncbi:MAG: sulfatase-like hydrolase/transferase [Planctomycetota bacterium]|nr:sulfatase-like hydrolase/transferase [Planctomycetota bacterium]